MSMTVVAELLALKGIEGDAEEVSDSRAETLPLCTRLQTTEPSSSLQRSIPVNDLWAYLAHQKTIGYRDLKAEYEACIYSVSQKYTNSILYVTLANSNASLFLGNDSEFTSMTIVCLS